MNAITQTVLCLASPLASNGVVAATACTAATRAMRGCSAPQRTFSTTPMRTPLRSTARGLMLQRRPLHINTVSKIDTERRNTVPRSQAGEALQALRGVPLSARRLQSTSVQHTCIKTEPSTTTLCSDCRGKISESSTKCPETRLEERAKTEKDKGAGTDASVLAFLLSMLVVLDIWHLS